MEKITYPNIPRNLVKNKRTLSTNPVPFKGGLFTFDPLLIEDFKPSKSVVTCYVVCNRRILLLKRNHLTDAGSTWCTPGGKLEQNETPLQAIIRETEEETGILLLPEETKLMKTIGVRIFVPKQDYLLHLFKAVLPKSQPSDYSVVLNQEHTDYLWIDPEEAKQLHLVPGGKEMLKSNLLGVFSEKGK
ncbi:NUDIX hydrolase [Cardinium endosymbiont of Nabis limbatus]|uniref:NUDIX hydrolase n=1 Tax=Cardinium endosymbiont of Nabis limbatus TaxID=3066217 RepID=UPI003AF372FB